MRTESVNRALHGVIISGAWIAGLYAVSPLVDGFSIVGIAQFLIHFSPGFLANIFISLFGFYAQPLLVGIILLTIIVGSSVLSILWPRFPEIRPSVRYGIVVFLTSLSLLLGNPQFDARLLLGIAIASLSPIITHQIINTASITTTERTQRRRFIRHLTTRALGITILLGVIHAILTRIVPQPTDSRVNTSLPTNPTPSPGDSEFDFGNMPSAVTSPSDHYVVDKNITNPRINSDSWSLSITGVVEEPYTLEYDELLNHSESMEQTMTMICISNEVGGELIGTGHWTGVQVSDLLEPATPHSSATTVVTHAEDGYVESFPLSMITREDILLAFGLGDRTLSVAHGFPARLLVPGRYGMKMTKWITTIEVTNEDHDGYWTERGWDKEAVVNPMAYIRDTHREGTTLRVGGVAFAGLETGVNEIAGVEVSLDGGETWQDATLEDPISMHAWRRWQHSFSAPETREFDFVARVITRDGTVQTSTRTPPRPGGATGWHHVTNEL